MDAVVGAWVLMIPPLEPGSHTIVLKDTVDDSTTEEADPATALYTATITVPAAE